MGIKEQWAAAGRTTVLLPSGFRVRGVLPSPTEVVRLKLVPWQLRQAVTAMSGKKLGTLSEAEHSQLVEARRYQTSAFIRQMAAPGTTGEDGWEDVHVTMDDLPDLPPLDLEALDDLIMGIKTAEMITADSELRLGLRDKESAERVAEEEAGETVDGWESFRDDGRRSGSGDAGGDVEPEAEPAAGRAKSAGRSRAGRRTRAAAAPDKGAGDEEAES